MGEVRHHLLAVAAHVVEPGHRQRRPETAAVGVLQIGGAKPLAGAALFLLLGVRLFEQTEAAVVVLDPVGPEACRLSLFPRPFDGAVQGFGRGGAGRDEPVIAGQVGRLHVGREPDHDPRLQLPRPFGRDGPGAVPAAHPGVALAEPSAIQSGQRRGHVGRQHDGAAAGGDVGDPDQLSRLPLQFQRVVDQLDPLVLGKAERLVRAEGRDGDPVPLHPEQCRRHGAVVPRPLVGGLAGRARLVDLHAVELVFQAGVAGAGRNRAGIGLRVFRAGVSRKRAGTGGGRLVQARKLPVAERALGLLVGQLQKARLPDRLHARCRIRPPQGGLADRLVLQCRHVPAPDVQIEEIALPVPDRLVLLVQEAAVLLAGEEDRLLQFALDAVHVVAAGGKIEVAGRRHRAVGSVQHDAERGAPLRAAAAADDVAGGRLVPARGDRRLLIPVGVQLRPPLLHQDGLVLLLGGEGVTGEVAFHTSIPPCPPPTSPLRGENLFPSPSGGGSGWGTYGNQSINTTLSYLEKSSPSRSWGLIGKSPTSSPKRRYSSSRPRQYASRRAAWPS